MNGVSVLLVVFLGHGLCADLPSVWPVSTTYASIDPAASADWMVSRLNASLIVPNVSSSCGEFAWVRLPGSGYEVRTHPSPTRPRARDLVTRA